LQGRHFRVHHTPTITDLLVDSGQSARTLFDQVRGELTDPAGTQQQRVAGGLHDLADERDRMGQNSDQSGLAASLVKQASDRTRSTAEWMSQREPGDLVSEARPKPSWPPPPPSASSVPDSLGG